MNNKPGEYGSGLFTGDNEIHHLSMFGTTRCEAYDNIDHDDQGELAELITTNEPVTCPDCLRDD